MKGRKVKGRESRRKYREASGTAKMERNHGQGRYGNSEDVSWNRGRSMNPSLHDHGSFKIDKAERRR